MLLDSDVGSNDEDDDDDDEDEEEEEEETIQQSHVEIVDRHFRTQQLKLTKRFLKINSSEVLRFKLH